MTLLAVEDLAIDVPGGRAVDGVSFTVEPGEVVALAGESGAGKSLTGAAIIGLLPAGARVAGGRVLLDGERIDDLEEHDWEPLRGPRIAQLVQDAAAALDPLRPVGAQIAQTLVAHHPLPAKVRRERIGDWLAGVGLARAQAGAYPGALSGRERQLLALALALCPAPDLLVADEPARPFDPPERAGVVALLRQRTGRRAAVLLLTRDAATAAAADRVLVMYAGRIVEAGPAARVLGRPAHPYTAALLAARPGPGPRRARLPTLPGAMPAPGGHPDGCAFHPRCVRVAPRCRTEPPVLTPEAPACFFPVAAP